MATNKSSAIEFPCEFPIKVFGTASDEFEIAVLTIIRQHVPDLKEDAIQTRTSKNGNYLAMTVTSTITSQQQLDNIYRDLTAHSLVMMAL